MEKQYKNILIQALLLIIILSCGVISKPPKTVESYAEIAKDFCIKNDMDTTICILIDMRLHSRLERMFLWSFKTDSVLFSCPVTHGIGGKKGVNGSTPNKPVFSNIRSSHASSIGKYKIGSRGWSNWGVHVNYKLHGLDTTNDNALKRYIVLHSWELVSDTASQDPSPHSWGCPAVSNNSMEILDSYLKQRANVLLWIYY